MLPFFDWLNSQHPNIQFTREEETNSSLAFLDICVKRDPSGCLSTSVYRKPMFSGLYLQWSSFVPKKYKRGLVSGLLHRAWRICSSFELFHQEVLFLKDTLQKNGYPYTFVDRCVKTFLDVKMNTQKSLPEFGPSKKPVMLCLPYIGINGDKIKRQLSRLLTATAPWIDYKIVFLAKNKLSRLSKLKCAIPTLSRSGVVYRVGCGDCEQFYVGMTTRRLKQRIDEHREDRNSALKEHSNTSNHAIDFNSVNILASDSAKSRLFVKEALKIREVSAHLSLNRNVRGCELKLW